MGRVVDCVWLPRGFFFTFENLSQLIILNSPMELRSHKEQANKQTNKNTQSSSHSSLHSLVASFFLRLLFAFPAFSLRAAPFTSCIYKITFSLLGNSRSRKVYSLPMGHFSSARLATMRYGCGTWSLFVLLRSSVLMSLGYVFQLFTIKKGKNYFFYNAP
jgi:hypothetical protein